MTEMEYRVVPAPARGIKKRGVKGAEDRFAAALSDALNAEALDGWQFLRSETLPCEERQGLTGSRTVFRSVLIFGRPRTLDERDAAKAAVQLLEHKSRADDDVTDEQTRAEPPVGSASPPPP